VTTNLEIKKEIASVLVTFHSNPLMEKIASAQSIFRGGSFKDFFTYFIGYPKYSFTYRKELQHSDAAVTVSNARDPFLGAEEIQKLRPDAHYRNGCKSGG
jgi:hypothetical protein